MKVLLIGHLSETTEKLQAVASKRGFQILHLAPTHLAPNQATANTKRVLLFAQDLNAEELKRALTSLREQGNSSPAIILSAQNKLQEELRELGPVSVLHPDCPFERVLQEVTAAGLAKTGKTIRDLGPLSINLLQKSANLHQNRLDLTETEFNLLVALTERPGKVVSNTRILSRVWGLQHDPQSNRVAVYMKKLREKLPEGMIENQRGVGYRLVIPDPN